MQTLTALPVKADQELVALLLHDVTLNRPQIQDFLESVGPDVAFMACAWFIGQLAVQEPTAVKAFAEMLTASIQIAGDMKVRHQQQNPGFVSDGLVVVLFPEMEEEQPLVTESIH